MSNYLKSSKNKLSTKVLRQYKKMADKKILSMLTCYDFQTAQLLNETSLDLILVGDSLGNVILGLETTVPVSIEIMKIFGRAVKKGAPQKFVIIDMPFGSYASYEQALSNAIQLFQHTEAEAIKIEGASALNLEIISRLTEIGIPVMGHIGLTPQSVHEMGGYFVHGKDSVSANLLLKEAALLQEAGVFSLVLECVWPEVSKTITNKLKIPTIGIGSGDDTDGQVLVINDLLKLGKERPPKFCKPIADLYEMKKNLIETYLQELN